MLGGSASGGSQTWCAGRPVPVQPVDDDVQHRDLLAGPIDSLDRFGAERPAAGSATGLHAERHDHAGAARRLGLGPPLPARYGPDTYAARNRSIVVVSTFR